MRIAYLDCFSGASGDMMLAALIDAGVPLEKINEAIDSLGLPGCRLTAARSASWASGRRKCSSSTSTNTNIAA